MAKSFINKFVLFLLVLCMVPVLALADETTGTTAESEPKNPTEATMASRCTKAAELKFPACATTPAECKSTLMKWQDFDYEAKSVTFYQEPRYPFNCIFLEEPIGGKPGYDLFKKVPSEGYVLWNGEAIVGNETGPYQAILTYEEGKETQGPFGLLYNYLALVYDFVSGLIVGFVILIVIVGGVRMSASRGDETAYTAGKNMIIKALIGMVLWFTASVILYTINPTFFAF